MRGACGAQIVRHRQNIGKNGTYRTSELPRDMPTLTKIRSAGRSARALSVEFVQKCAQGDLHCSTGVPTASRERPKASLERRPGSVLREPRGIPRASRSVPRVSRGREGGAPHRLRSVRRRPGWIFDDVGSLLARSGGLRTLPRQLVIDFFAFLFACAASSMSRPTRAPTLSFSIVRLDAASLVCSGTFPHASSLVYIYIYI